MHFRILKMIATPEPNGGAHDASPYPLGCGVHPTRRFDSRAFGASISGTLEPRLVATARLRLELGIIESPNTSSDSKA